MTMIVINFSHPFTEQQRAQIGELAGKPVSDVRDVTTRLDNNAPFAYQIAALIEAAGLDARAWQTKAILVNPPAFTPAATTLIAELHGRMGYFPPIIRIRPVPDSLPPEYEVAEIINLQAVRDAARKRRE